jgi:hypothetical protein
MVMPRGFDPDLLALIGLLILLGRIVTPLVTSLGTALRTARLPRGYTLGETATATQLTLTRLVRIERGEVTPRHQEFTKVWNFLASSSDAPSAAPSPERVEQSP